MVEVLILCEIPLFRDQISKTNRLDNVPPIYHANNRQKLLHDSDYHSTEHCKYHNVYITDYNNRANTITTMAPVCYPLSVIC